MNKYTKLFEFAYKLIDIQIKKYVALATMGVGPDARLNASLVLDEVNELLELTNQLLKNLENNLHDEASFKSIFNQIKFFIEQEHIRAYAGWLLDPNNIHTPVKERLDEQLAELKDIAVLAKIDFSLPSKPITLIQRKCESDSLLIAHYILDLAIKIKENPMMDFDEKVPSHAQTILRRNAMTRYCDETFAKPIKELHEKYSAQIKNSDNQYSNTNLVKTDAKENEVIHKQKLNQLLERYKNRNSSSELFSKKYQGYEISNFKPTQPSSTNSINKFMLFGTVFCGVLLCMLISYFSQKQKDNTLKP